MRGLMPVSVMMAVVVDGHPGGVGHSVLDGLGRCLPVGQGLVGRANRVDESRSAAGYRFRPDDSVESTLMTCLVSPKSTSVSLARTFQVIAGESAAMFLVSDSQWGRRWLLRQSLPQWLSKYGRRCLGWYNGTSRFPFGQRANSGTECREVPFRRGRELPNLLQPENQG